jgi:hypothetical protein
VDRGNRGRADHRLRRFLESCLAVSSYLQLAWGIPELEEVDRKLEQFVD